MRLLRLMRAIGRRRAAASASARARRARVRHGPLLARRASRSCARELRGWQRAAAAIPDPALRAQALATLRERAPQRRRRRAVRDDAPRRREPALVRALVAYQVICDYLDTLAEQPAADPIAQRRAAAPRARRRGRREAAGADYYRLHRRARRRRLPRRARRRLPRAAARAARATQHVRAAARREARRNEVQGVNHAPVAEREPALAALGGREARRRGGDASWFELAAAGELLARRARAARGRRRSGDDRRPTPSGPRSPTSRGSRRSARCSTASSTASATRAPASSDFVEPVPVAGGGDRAPAGRSTTRAIAGGTQPAARRAPCRDRRRDDRDAPLAGERAHRRAPRRPPRRCCARPARRSRGCWSCCCAPGGAPAGRPRQAAMACVRRQLAVQADRAAHAVPPSPQ